MFRSRPVAAPPSRLATTPPDEEILLARADLASLSRFKATRPGRPPAGALPTAGAPGPAKAVAPAAAPVKASPPNAHLSGSTDGTSWSRHVGAAAATFVLTIGAGVVMQNRDTLAQVTGGAGLAQGASGASDRAPALASLPPLVPQALPVLAAEAGRVPTLPAMAARAPAPDAATRDLTSELVEVVPVAFEDPEPMALAPIGPEAAPDLADPEPTGPDLASPEAAPPAATPSPTIPYATAAACDLALRVVVAPEAMLRVALDAPCDPDAAVTLHHAGMSVTLLTDAEGRAVADLPALAATAVVMADLGELAAVATVAVPDMAAYDRAVLQWRGPPGPQIHAREFGAAYGAPGHVWSGAPDGAGSLVRLGDPAAPDPRLAEVYTYPSGLGARAGLIEIGVEAEVTPTTCGRELEAQTIQVSPGTRPFALDLALTMPGCEAMGEWVVLGDLLLDLTVAGR